MALTDTHCHLNHGDFADDWRAALERAREAGVKRLLVVGFDLASSRLAVEMAQSESDIQAVIGIHPESAAEWTPSTRDELLGLLSGAGNHIAAWGEVGLDYYWDSVPRDVQVAVFEEQIEIAKSASLPLVIHCREAFTDVLDVLETHGNPPAVLHCFTGTQAEADRAVAAGCYIGVGGIATFKKSDALREIVRSVPLDKLLLETDSPYLAPQARRGKRNEPAYVAFVADVVAPLFGLSADELATTTSENADRLFGVLR
ncbi:MAG TPA: TatD family hydrolase [Capsulimonadaceae bacterium]